MPKLFIRFIVFLASITMHGCAMAPSGPWHMPKKDSPDSGAIFGSIQSEGDRYLNLNKIYLRKEGKFFHEDVIIMVSNKFIAPNLEPGTYYLTSFQAGDYIHHLPDNFIPPIIIKPGQLKFVGAYWYKDIEGGFLELDKYSLKPAKKPSEMDMLRWLEGISIDTGWEPSIKKRIIKLGGKPITAAERLKSQKATK